MLKFFKKLILKILERYSFYYFERNAREFPLRSDGKKKNALEALILIFRKISSEQKILHFGRRIHFRGEPARHETTRPAVTLTDGLYLVVHCSNVHQTSTKVGYNQ